MNTHIIKTDDIQTIITSIPSYKSETLCEAINTSFDIIARGTSDFSLQICSIKDGSIQKVISLDNRKPKRIEISPGWGFITVFVEKNMHQKQCFEMLLYTINGTFIRSCQIESDILTWCFWSDNSDFDHICFALTGGKVFACELYYLNPGSFLYRSQSKLISLQYIKKLKSIIKDLPNVTKPEAINEVFSKVLNNCNTFNFSTMSKTFMQSFIQNYLLNQKYLCESSLFLCSISLLSIIIGFSFGIYCSPLCKIGSPILIHFNLF